MPKNTVLTQRQQNINKETQKVDYDKPLKKKEKEIDRKCREIQTQKIKMREEMLNKMKEIDSVVKSLELKYFKKINPNSAKIEEFLDSKFYAILNVLEEKESEQKRSIEKEALTDLRSKLKES